MSLQQDGPLFVQLEKALYGSGKLWHESISIRSGQKNVRIDLSVPWRSSESEVHHAYVCEICGDIIGESQVGHTRTYGIAYFVTVKTNYHLDSSTSSCYGGTLSFAEGLDLTISSRT